MIPLENGRAVIHRAFDLGITHFDLANNYGPPFGSAEENFGRILAKDLAPYRDELVISSKAGYIMWPGPYGEWGSRKYLVASCDQSLKRMGLEYVDIFYSHRSDPNTPLEETMGALDFIVRSGRALYAGISTYNPEQTRQAAAILRGLGTPCLIHQPRYNMFDRWIEDGLLDVLDGGRHRLHRLLAAVPGHPDRQVPATMSRTARAPASGQGQLHWGDSVSEERIAKVRKLNEIAGQRGQTMAQMAIAWVLRHPGMTSALIGASRVDHIESAVAALDRLDFSADELAAIESILAS